MAAFASGNSILKNINNGYDSLTVINALRALGVVIEHDSTKHNVKVYGIAGKHQSKEKTIINSHESGLCMRLMTAMLSAGYGHYAVHAAQRMEQRPIHDLVGPLTNNGAIIKYNKRYGMPPIDIFAQGLQGGDIHIKGDISSQYTSALLMATAFATNSTTIHLSPDSISLPYIDLTLDLLEKFMVQAYKIDTHTIMIPPQQNYKAQTMIIEPDISAASYFFAYALINKKCITISNIASSKQPGMLFLNAIEQMGAKISNNNNAITVAYSQPLQAITIDMAASPDEAMTLAILALFAKGTTTITNIASWRYKESNRLQVMTTELRKVGAIVSMGDNFIAITGIKELCNATIATHNDHRIAMCFALLDDTGCLIKLDDKKCVAKSFPDFFKILQQCKNTCNATILTNS